MESMWQDLRPNHELGSDDRSEQELVAVKTEQSHERELRTPQLKPQQPQRISDTSGVPKRLPKEAKDTRQERIKDLKNRIVEKGESDAKRRKLDPTNSGKDLSAINREVEPAKKI